MLAPHDHHDLQLLLKWQGILYPFLHFEKTEGSVQQKSILEKANATHAQLKALIEKGVLVTEKRKVDRLAVDHTKGDIHFHALTTSQSNALQDIQTQLETQNVSLLHGITGSGKTLATEIGKNWFTFINNGGTTPGEYLFSMKVTAQDGTNALNTYFGRTISTYPGSAGRSDCKIKAAHFTQYETGDKRKDYFVLSGGNYYSLKHLDRFGDVPVVRLSEMYLTRAEANQRNTTVVGASPLSDVNAIRTRAGLPALTAVTLADILKERKLELAFEGQFLPDAKRTQTAVGTLAWNSPKLIMPIPQREMDVNKQLVQNEGY